MAPKDLSALTTDELTAELERRKKTLPTPLANPDFTGLTRMIVEGIREVAETNYKNEDFDHYVFEAALEAVYGKTIWTWWNNRP